jgi:transposase
MVQAITPDYEQQFLLPPALEEWVPADHPARFIREFVEQLDLVALGFALPACADGRPPYAPSLLLKIWLYGYLQRIRSTRKLEAACREHLSLLWLTGLIQPDHNSLWRFWRANQKPLRAVFKQTVQVAVRTGCVGLVVQALDGTKLAAAASSHTGWTQEHMAKLLAALDEALVASELEILREDPEAPGYRLPAGLAERQQLREQIKTGLAQLAADGRRHYHPVEPEARRMKTREGNRYAYNAQAMTDGQCGIITAADVTRQETDTGQLVPLIVQTQATIGVAATPTETLADSGYGAGADLQAAAAQNLPVLVPPAEGAPAKDKPYASRNFHYDEAAQTVTCPQDRPLVHEGGTTRDGHRVERYRCPHRDCPVRAQCSPDPKGRQIEIHPHTPVVQAMRQRLATPEGQALYRSRAPVAERTFGRIKQHDAFRRFTVWGLEAVRTQWALVCAAANLRILYARWRERLARPSGPGAPLAWDARAVA